MEYLFFYPVFETDLTASQSPADDRGN